VTLVEIAARQAIEKAKADLVIRFRPSEFKRDTAALKRRRELVGARCSPAHCGRYGQRSKPENARKGPESGHIDAAAETNEVPSTRTSPKAGNFL
jgi:hypothetical protein